MTPSLPLISHHNRPPGPDPIVSNYTPCHCILHESLVVIVLCSSCNSRHSRPPRRACVTSLRVIAYVQSLSAERSHGDRIGRTLPPLQLNGTLRHDTIINFYLYTCVVACRSTYFHRNILCEICRKHSTSGNYVKNRIADPKRSFPDPKEVNNRRKYPLCEG